MYFTYSDNLKALKDQLSSFLGEDIEKQSVTSTVWVGLGSAEKNLPPAGPIGVGGVDWPS